MGKETNIAVIFMTAKNTVPDTIFGHLNEKEDSGSPETHYAEIAKIGNDFISSLFTPDVEIMATAEDGVEIFNTGFRKKLPEKIKNSHDNEQIYSDVIGRMLYIYAETDYKGHDIFLVYTCDLHDVYERFIRYVLILIICLMIFYAVLVAMIALLSKRLAMPLNHSLPRTYASIRASILAAISFLFIPPTVESITLPFLIKKKLGMDITPN